MNDDVLAIVRWVAENDGKFLTGFMDEEVACYFCDADLTYKEVHRPDCIHLLAQKAMKDLTTSG